MKRVMTCGFFSFLIFLASSAFPYSEEECITCHGIESEQSIFRISVDSFMDSVHGGILTCEDCHMDIIDEEHESMKGYASVHCADCHEEENLHGSGYEEGVTPECSACHSKHSILPKTDENSWVHPKNLEDTCGACHHEQTGRGGFFSWIGSIQVRSHGKQNLTFEYDRGDCLGCHQGKGAHGEKDVINDRNCQECHKPFGEAGALLGSIHPFDKKNGFFFNLTLKTVYVILFLSLIFGGILYFIKIFSNKNLK